MDCSKIMTHISSVDCDLPKIEKIDKTIIEEIKNIEVDGYPQEDITGKITCYETYID